MRSQKCLDSWGHGLKTNIREFLNFVCLLLLKCCVCLTNDRGQTDVANRPFHGFFFLTFDTDKLGKISQLRCKDRLQISRVATFEIDLLKTKED